jgi:hypothetical protein
MVRGAQAPLNTKHITNVHYTLEWWGPAVSHVQGVQRQKQHDCEVPKGTWGLQLEGQEELELWTEVEATWAEGGS